MEIIRVKTFCRNCNTSSKMQIFFEDLGKLTCRDCSNGDIRYQIQDEDLIKLIDKNLITESELNDYINNEHKYNSKAHEEVMLVRKKKVLNEIKKIKPSISKPSQQTLDRFYKGDARQKEPDGSKRSDWVKDRSSWKKR